MATTRWWLATFADDDEEIQYEPHDTKPMPPEDGTVWAIMNRDFYVVTCSPGWRTHIASLDPHLPHEVPASAQRIPAPPR